MSLFVQGVYLFVSDVYLFVQGVLFVFFLGSYLAAWTEA